MDRVTFPNATVHLESELKSKASNERKRSIIPSSITITQPKAQNIDEIRKQ